MSTGESIRDPTRLLREMRPRINEGVFAFCILPAGVAVPSGAIGWFREAEGETVILPSATARAAGLETVIQAAWITLDVHSAFDAVGLTAAVAAALAADGIACNVVAAVRHDHIFVPVERAADALTALERVSAHG